MPPSSQSSRTLNILLKLGVDTQGVEQAFRRIKNSADRFLDRLTGSGGKIPFDENLLNQVLGGMAGASGGTGKTGRSPQDLSHIYQQVAGAALAAGAPGITPEMLRGGVFRDLQGRFVGADAVREAVQMFGTLQAQAVATSQTTGRSIGSVFSNVINSIDKTIEDGLKALDNFEEEMKARQPGVSDVPPEEASRRIARVWQLGIAGFTLSMTGSAIQQVVQPIFQSVSKYIQSQGILSSLGVEWSSATRDIERSFSRIVSLVARELLPALQDAAKLVKRIADFIEENPTLASGIAKVAVGGFIVGGLFQVIGQLMSAVATFGNIAILLQQAIAKTMIGQAIGTGARFVGNVAGGALGISAAGASVIGGLIAGAVGSFLLLFLYEELRPALEEITGHHLASLAEVATILAYLYGRFLDQLFGILKEGPFGAILRYSSGEGLYEQTRGTEELTKLVAELTGAPEKYEASMARLQKIHEENLPQITEAAVDAYRKFKDQLIKAEEETGEQRQQIVEKYLERIQELEESHAENRAKIAEDLAKNIQRANKDLQDRIDKLTKNYLKQEAKDYDRYLKDRQQAAKQAGKDLEELEREHQRRLREILISHQMRVDELVAARDAIGLVNENRRFNDETRKENERYAEELRKKNQQQTERMKDLQKNFEEERAERQADYEERLAELKEEHEERLTELRKAAEERYAEEQKAYEKQLAQLKTAKEKELQTLENAYQKQLKTINDAFVEQIRQLDATLLSDYDAWIKHMQNLSTEFQTWLKNYKSNLPGSQPGTAQGRASGGYVSNGLYRVGEAGQEFVLNAQTTRALESAIGGKLTQSRILRGFMGSGPVSVNVNQTIDVHGYLTAAETESLMLHMREETRRGILETIGVD